MKFMSSLSTLIFVVVFMSSLACGALCAICLNRRCAKASTAMNVAGRPQAEAKTIDMQVIAQKSLGWVPHIGMRGVNSKSPPQVVGPIGGAKNDNNA